VSFFKKNVDSVKKFSLILMLFYSDHVIA